MEILEKEKTMKLFITPDGKEFLSKSKAKSYTDNTLKRKDNIKYFKVTYGPDLTEGRGYHKLLLVAVERSYAHKLILEEFCEKYIGSRIAWVMGAAPMENWRITESSEESFMSSSKEFVYCGDYKYSEKKLFLSNSNKELEDYPNHVVTPKREKDEYIFLKEEVKDVI